MTNESILISEVIPATPQRIFSAWMDSAEHSAFTGDEATVVPEVGGEHRAAGGYIQGRTLELNEGARIVQSWRTTEFPPESPDSRVEITLEPTMGGTLVTLLHTDIPVGQGDRYRQGWNEYYLSRLKSYFGDVDQPASTRGAMKGGGNADADLGLDGDVDVASEVVDLDPTSVSEAPTKVVKVPKIAKAATKTATTSATKPTALKAKPASPPAKQPAAKLTAKSAAKPAKKPVKLAASSPAKGARTAARRGAKRLRTAAKGAMKSARTAMKRAVKSAKTLMKGVAKSAARKAPKAAKGRAKKVAKAAPSRRAVKKRGASSARSRRR